MHSEKLPADDGVEVMGYKECVTLQGSGSESCAHTR